MVMAGRVASAMPLAVTEMVAVPAPVPGAERVAQYSLPLEATAESVPSVVLIETVAALTALPRASRRVTRMAPCAGPGRPRVRQLLVTVTGLLVSMAETQSVSLAEVQPGAQQPSALTQAVMAGWVQRASQVPVVPVSTSPVQRLPSSGQEVGQAPSQSSPDSTTLLPQVGSQSVSRLALAPKGQQRSPEEGVVMVVRAQATPQAAPSSVSMVQKSPSSQAARTGQEASGSQVSPNSTTSLSQTGAQSLSLLAFAIAGQQPSPSAALTMAGKVQARSQLPALPTSTSAVQARPSSQEVGQLAPSQVSPGSTMPLPQAAEQSLSLLALQPGAQQPSPFVQTVTGALSQAALQEAALPTTLSVVQALVSLQEVGQAPSQVSMPSTTPLPQTAEQSLSTEALAPSGQQPSASAGAVMAASTHSALQFPALPMRRAVAQTLDGAQLVGQFPSQVSKPSTTPLPQEAEQSLSVALVQLLGQQPSPLTQRVMSLMTQAASQLAALPLTDSAVQAELSAQEASVGQLSLGSQSSPGSRMVLPQTGSQSSSSAAEQPSPQQPSPFTHSARGAVTQAAAQSVPSSRTVVQEAPASQLVGQAPGWPAAMAVSQASAPSMTLLPQSAGSMSGVVSVVVSAVVSAVESKAVSSAVPVSLTPESLTFVEATQKPPSQTLPSGQSALALQTMLPAAGASVPQAASSVSERAAAESPPKRERALNATEAMADSIELGRRGARLSACIGGNPSEIVAEPMTRCATEPPPLAPERVD